ncbi:unnamed protein product [Cunninghamella blakesleeana]
MITLSISILLITTIFTYAYYTVAHYEKGIPLKNNNILLLTANPDDECMFFGPTLTSLKSSGTKSHIHVLCLSTGDADGLGSIRKKELSKSCQTFNILPSHIKALNHDELQDGMKNNWSSTTIAKIIHGYVTKHKIDTIITFDDYGVSGHPNHIASYFGAKEYAKNHPNIQVYKLISITLLRKYIATLDLLPLSLKTLLSPNNNDNLTFVSSPGAYLLTHKAMRQHRSQLVWFRWLYVTFSRYMYINELQKI